MKPLPDLETAKREALEVLRESLGRFGAIQDHEWVGSSIGQPSDPGYDLKLRYHLTNGLDQGKDWWLHVIVKTVVHPKQASHAIWNLKKSLGQTVRNEAIYPILIAPFISESVAARCEEEQIGHLDLSGNCKLEFGGIWIDRSGQPRKYKEKQNQKSLFTPKATRVLRVLLQGPLKSYLVNELASKAEVSLGHVSKLRRLLLDEELAEETKTGIRIKGAEEAGTILRHWLAEDDFLHRTQIKEYSTLTSDSTLAGKLLVFCEAHRSHFSHDPLFTLNFGTWLRAPHNVPTTVSAYFDRIPDEDELLSFLKARPVSKGAGNLRIIVPSDYYAVTIGQQRVKGNPEFSVVSDLQLFLDLHGGEANGPEQAEVLRHLENFNGGWA